MLDPYGCYMERVKLSSGKDEHKNEYTLFGQSGINVVHGLLSGRPSGGASVVGASVGGAIDGLILKPTLDATIKAIGRGARWAYGIGDRPDGSTNLPT